MLNPSSLFKSEGAIQQANNASANKSNTESEKVSVKSLPIGVVYRRNCETTLKNVLDNLSLTAGHLLINAYVDVERIYSKTGNLSVTIQDDGTAHISALKSSTIDALTASELKIYNYAGGLCLTTAGDGTTGEITVPYLNATEVNTALIESAAGLTFTSATDYPITFDDGAPEDSIGTPHFILEENRPTSWILSGGASASFADVDCSSYTPVGVKALILSYALVFTGNGTLDFAIVNARRNGSSETLDSKTRFMSCEYLNLASGVIFAVSGQRTVLCDSNGVFEYKVANGVLYINLEGYYY